MKIKTFVFNSFLVNTYLIQNDSGEVVIVDPACYNDTEQNELKSYIENKRLNVKMALSTHGHIDHILGNQFVQKTFNCPLLAHKDSEMYYKHAPSYGSVFSLDASDIGYPDGELNDGQEIELGELKFEIIYTPGHAEGSVCIHIPEEKVLFSGDVLFQMGIGRTDLPGGNYNVLMDSIKNKLFNLPEETLVYPGHGPSTTIGAEKNENPFF
ncbi:MAG: MBL fold hydrolase [Marinilabiliales bacterium]|nr:MAG: MBL fold hydrolase [Marinilabiliales bacterium]